MKIIKELTHKNVAHKFVALALIVTLCFGSVVSVFARSDKNDFVDPIAYLSKKPEVSRWIKLNPEQKQVWLKAHLIRKPIKPSLKPTLKLTGKKKKINIKTNAKHKFQIIYSMKKSFKNYKAIYTNKKRYTIFNLKKKTKYYVKVRCIQKYYYINGYTVLDSNGKIEFDNFCEGQWNSLMGDEENKFNEGCLYGPWSKVKKVKTK